MKPKRPKKINRGKDPEMDLKYNIKRSSEQMLLERLHMVL